MLAGSPMIGSMGPHHRAQLAAAVAQFLADIRRLGRAKLRNERDRFLATLEPSRARSAVTKEVRRPPRRQAKSPGRRLRAATSGQSSASATATRRTRTAGAVKPTPPSGGRRSTATRPAPEPATAAPRQASAPVNMQGAPPRVGAVEATPATPVGLAAQAIAAPQANAALVIAAPVTATPATEASSVPTVQAVAMPATEGRRLGVPAAGEQDHGGRQDSARRRGTVKCLAGPRATASSETMTAWTSSSTPRLS